MYCSICDQKYSRDHGQAHCPDCEEAICLLEGAYGVFSSEEHVNDDTHPDDVLLELKALRARLTLDSQSELRLAVQDYIKRYTRKYTR